VSEERGPAEAGSAGDGLRDAPPETQQRPPSRSRDHLYVTSRPPVGKRLPVAIVVIGAGLVTGVQFYFHEDNAHRFLATASAVALTVVLLFVWFLLGAGLRWRTRIALLVLVGAAIGAFRYFVRVEGVSGDFVPSFTWRAVAKKDEALREELPAVGESSTADLATPTDHDWPQFLGPKRDGTAEGTRLATDWPLNPPEPLWRQPIGAGWSSFAVMGEWAVTQEQRGEDELVVCYALETGEVAWSHATPGRYDSVVAGDGPRATPTINGGRVFAMGAVGELVCLEGATGEAIWSHDVVEEHGAKLPQWGKSCSPLVWNDLVIVSAGGGDGQSLVAYDRGTGDTVWTGGDDPSSYSSPTMAAIAGMPQALIVNSKSLAGHDPSDGRVLWRYDWEGNEPKVPQPYAFDGDRVFITAGYGLGSQMLQLVTGPEGTLVAEQLWQNRQLKPKFTSPVVHDGYAYGIDDGKSLVCLDLETGKTAWRGGRYGHGQILLVDDLLVVQTEFGEIILVAADPNARTELGRFQAIEGKSWTIPAIAGSLLLVRNAEEAACYRLPTIDAVEVDEPDEPPFSESLP